MNTPDAHDDWLDAVEGRRLSADETAALRRQLAARPREAARLADELALNAALDGLPPVPVPSNFAARVWADIDREPQSKARRGPGWLAWLGGFRLARTAVFATALVAAAAGWWQFQTHQRGVLATSLTEVSQVFPDVEALRDYDAIQALRATPLPGDVELVAALAQ